MHAGHDQGPEIQMFELQSIDRFNSHELRMEQWPNTINHCRVALQKFTGSWCIIVFNRIGPKGWTVYAVVG